MRPVVLGPLRLTRAHLAASIGGMFAIGWAIWFAVTYIDRTIARSRREFLHEHCPDLASLDTCEQRLSRARDEEDARARRQRDAAEDAAKTAAARARADELASRRARQSADPHEINELLDEVVDDAQHLKTVPRCGPQMKGWAAWAAENAATVARLEGRLDAIVGETSPMQAETIKQLRDAFAASHDCGPCTYISKRACAREMEAIGATRKTRGSWEERPGRARR